MFGKKKLRRKYFFDRELEKTDSLHWTVDGIHPTNAGHKLIAGEWKHYALG